MDDLLRVGYSPSYIPQTFDYTSRDYYAIRDHLINVVKTRVPEWTGEDPSDFALALVEAFAYMGDLMSYYIDRAGNEAYLPTATRRQSVINIARTLGYTPGRAVSAQGEVTFTSEPTSTGPAISVPAGTMVNASIKREDGTQDVVRFSTNTTITVPTAGQSTTVAVTEGYAETVTFVSDGSANQEFAIPLYPVSANSIKVSLYDTVTSTLWNEVTNLIEYTAQDNAYETTLMSDGSVLIRFGDGVNGRVPPPNHQIIVEYRVGGGTRGNIPAGLITTIEDSSLDIPLNVTNQASTFGGTDEESTYSIRQNASLGLRANRRAVTGLDLESLAVGVPGVYAAKANASVWSNITLAIAPLNDGTLSPGLTGTTGTDVITGDETTQQVALKASVKSEVEPLMMMGSSLTLRSPHYAKVKLNLTVKLIDTASQKFATSDITGILKEGPLSFERRGFGGSLTVTDLISAITYNNPYVRDVTVNTVCRKDDSITTGVRTTTADWFEILVLDAANDLTLDFAGTGINDI